MSGEKLSGEKLSGEKLSVRNCRVGKCRSEKLSGEKLSWNPLRRRSNHEICSFGCSKISISHILIIFEVQFVKN